VLDYSELLRVMEIRVRDAGTDWMRQNHGCNKAGDDDRDANTSKRSEEDNHLVIIRIPM
jgi:hypothetical protein